MFEGQTMHLHLILELLHDAIILSSPSLSVQLENHIIPSTNRIFAGDFLFLVCPTRNTATSFNQNPLVHGITTPLHLALLQTPSRHSEGILKKCLGHAFRRDPSGLEFPNRFLEFQTYLKKKHMGNNYVVIHWWYVLEWPACQVLLVFLFWFWSATPSFNMPIAADCQVASFRRCTLHESSWILWMLKYQDTMRYHIRNQLERFKEWGWKGHLEVQSPSLPNFGVFYWFHIGSHYELDWRS